MINIKRTKQKKNLKVAIAMSGGVDSSVAAALLKEAGFDVVGVFMKLWGGYKLNKEYNRHCSKEAEKRARKAASILKIPFYAINFKKEFKNHVVDYFLVNYKKGITPNPCVVCNKRIKFGLLLKKAKSLGANFIATGHYARIKKQNNELSLIKAEDKEKDQSYFLWKLNQSQLKNVLFPVGGYKKSEVRKLAKDFNLSVFDTPESQEVCFISKNRTNEFLKKYLKTKPGPIVEQVHYGASPPKFSERKFRRASPPKFSERKFRRARKIIGRHEGLWFYTIGQRKGIKLPDGPFYVINKDKKKNVLIVSKNKKDLYEKEAVLKQVNWLSKKEPKLPLKVQVKIRYHHKPVKATIDRKYILKFDKEQKAITPGQSAVFYEKNKILGGGIIS